MSNPAELYYNPSPNDDEVRALLRRNYLVLMTGQAALGLVGPDTLGIAVEPKAGAVVIHVAARHHSPEIAKDIDDIASELDVLLAGGPEQTSTITTEPHVGPPDRTWPGHHHELLYLAKT